MEYHITFKESLKFAYKLGILLMIIQCHGLLHQYKK